MKLEALMPTVAKMELVHPAKGPMGVYLHLIGQDTKAFRDKARAVAKALNDKKNKVEFDQLEQQNIEMVATCIVGWSDELSGEDGFGTYTPARALELMQKEELSWVKEQVEEFVKDRANFFREPGEAA